MHDVEFPVQHRRVKRVYRGARASGRRVPGGRRAFCLFNSVTLYGGPIYAHWAKLCQLELVAAPERCSRGSEVHAAPTGRRLWSSDSGGDAIAQGKPHSPRLPLPHDRLLSSVFGECRCRPFVVAGESPDIVFNREVVVTPEPVVLERSHEQPTGGGIDAQDAEGVEYFAAGLRALVLDEEEVASVPSGGVGADPGNADRRTGCRSPTCLLTLPSVRRGPGRLLAPPAG